MAVRAKITPQNLYNGMRVVAFAMEKGGAGKTTLALHFAIRAALGYIPEITGRVLLVDVDQQQNSSKTLLRMETVEGEGYSIPPIHEAYNPNDPADVEWGGRSNSVDLYYGNPVEPYVSEVSANLDVLPSDGSVMQGFEDLKDDNDVPLLEYLYQQFYKFCSQKVVQDEYDLIIFDCPPGKTLITTPVIRAATDIVLPTELGAYGVDGVQRMLYEIKKENEFRPCELNILGVIPNLFKSNRNKHKSFLKQLRENEETGPYVVPYELKDLVHMGLDKMPERRITTAKLPEAQAEGQVQVFIEHLRRGMFPESFIAATA